MPTIAGSSDEIIPLWPEGPPSRLEGVGAEATYVAPAGVAAGTTMLRNITDATISVFRPAPGAANGVGIIVSPGGGWRISAWQHEGVDVAHWLAARGYTAFLLKYRVGATPADHRQFLSLMAGSDSRLAAPLAAAEAPRTMGAIIDTPDYRAAREAAAEDGRRALSLIRARAATWDIRPDAVGMIGFSAGAFLSVDVALDPQGPPLAFVAAIYGGETRGRPVPADAPPLFTLIAQDDRLLFRVVEGLYADWSQADRPSEIHVFRRGAHGFGMITQGLPVDTWPDLLHAWLKDLGHG